MNIKVDLSVAPEDVIDNKGESLDIAAIPEMLKVAAAKGIVVITNTNEGSFMIGHLNPSWMSSGRRGRD